MKKKGILDFFKYFVINLMNKYGSFMWIGTHIGMTQVDWHWVLEIFPKPNASQLVSFQYEFLST